jgi:putative transposase
MTYSHASLFIHAIWSTKSGVPMIRSKVEKHIHKRINELFNTSGCHVISINGMSDHVHVLFIQNSDIDLSILMKLVKSGITYYINSNSLVKKQFSWQKGYLAFPVPMSSLPRVRAYIQNQKEYHERNTVEEECEELIKGIEFDVSVHLKTV